MVVNIYIKMILQRSQMEMRSMLLKTGGKAMLVIKRQKKKKKITEMCSFKLSRFQSKVLE